MIDGKAMVATHYEGRPMRRSMAAARAAGAASVFLEDANGRASLQFIAQDEPGFWEQLGYHMYGDPERAALCRRLKSP